MKYLLPLLACVWAAHAQMTNILLTFETPSYVASVTVNTNGGTPPEELPPENPTSRDPGTNASCVAYWWGQDLASSYTNAEPVPQWVEKKAGVLIWQTTGSQQPTRQTDTGKAILRLDGVDDTMLLQGYNWATLLAANQGTMIFRVKMSSLTTRNALLYWTAGTDVITCWLPYETDIYFDWAAADGTGRITTANPAGLLDTWHSVIYRRNTDGTQSIRIDGTNVVSGTKSATLTTASTGDFCLGSTSSGGSNWTGMDVRGIQFWNAYLSDADADAYAKWME